jgi:hypothetical protein
MKYLSYLLFKGPCQSARTCPFRVPGSKRRRIRCSQRLERCVKRY